jgi:hypothetical protein
MLSAFAASCSAVGQPSRVMPAVTRMPASVEIASAPIVIQWSPWRSWMPISLRRTRPSIVAASRQ